MRRVPGAEYPNKSVLVPVVRVQEAAAIFFNGCPVQISHDFAQVVVFLVIPRRIRLDMCYVSETEGIIADLAWKGLIQVVKEIFEGGMVAHSTNTTECAIFSKSKSSKQTFCYTKVKRRGGYCKFVLP